MMTLWIIWVRVGTGSIWVQGQVQDRVQGQVQGQVQVQVQGQSWSEGHWPRNKVDQPMRHLPR